MMVSGGHQNVVLKSLKYVSTRNFYYQIIHVTRDIE